MKESIKIQIFDSHEEEIYSFSEKMNDIEFEGEERVYLDVPKTNVKVSFDTLLVKEDKSINRKNLDTNLYDQNVKLFTIIDKVVLTLTSNLLELTKFSSPNHITEKFE